MEKKTIMLDGEKVDIVVKLDEEEREVNLFINNLEDTMEFDDIFSNTEVVPVGDIYE